MFLIDRIKRLGVTLVVVIILNIVAFSPGLVGITFGDSALLTALGVTLIIGSIIAIALEVKGFFGYTTEPPIDVDRLDSHEDFIRGINVFDGLNEIRSEVNSVKSHLRQIETRRRSMQKALADRFQPTEITYRRFNGVYQEVERLFYANIKSILSKLKLLYSHNTGSGADRSILSPEVIKERELLRAEYIKSVRRYIQVNEEILLKLDRLLLEITRLETVDVNEVESLACLKEIDSLIKQTKYYRD